MSQRMWSVVRFGLVFAAAHVAAAPRAWSQTAPQFAISREVSVYSCGGPACEPAFEDALSRELAVYNCAGVVCEESGGEALSREVAVYNCAGVVCESSGGEALSRELAVYNCGGPSCDPTGDAISREFSVLNALTCDVGPQLVTFEELPSGTVPTDQYRDRGILFRVTSGSVQATSAQATRFVPRSGVRVLADPGASPAATGAVEITFVVPGTGVAAATTAFSCFVIDAESTGATVTAYDPDDVPVFSAELHGGPAFQERVSITGEIISRVVVTLGQGADTSAIDDVCFARPTSLAPPDLVVAGIEAPATATSGAPVSVRFSVENAGGFRAEAPWFDRVLVSPNPVEGDGDDLIVGDFAAPSSLDPGTAPYEQTKSIQLPTAPGDYWIIVVSDSTDLVEELFAESNNTRVADSPIRVTPIARPDLAVTAIAPLAEAHEGLPANVRWTVENAGAASVEGTWTESVYLSADAVPGGPDDVLLARVTQVGPLLAGSSVEHVSGASIPGGALGDRYLVVVLDSGGVIAEEDESNNALAAATPTRVLAPDLPDLVVASALAPERAPTREPIQVAFTVENAGRREAAGGWTDIVFLSANAALDSSDVEVARLPRAEPLPIGGTYSATAPVVLPGTPGEYFLIVVTNFGRGLEEGLHTDNNVRAIPIGVDQRPLPDLALGAIVPPEPGEPGSAVMVSWTVANAGAATASGRWSERLLASTDANLGGDVVLANFVFDEAAIEPGGVRLRSESVPVPDLPEGYWLVVVLDPNGSIEESNEANNAGIANERSRVSRPDLVASEVTAPATALADSSVLVSWRVRNESDTAALGGWVDTVSLRRRGETAGEIVVGSRFFAGPLAPLGEYTASAAITVPGRLSGDYEFLVRADSTDIVRENGADSNNVAVSPVPTRIDQPERPNLVTARVDVPPPALVSSPLSDLRLTVRNDGAVAASGFWVDEIRAVEVATGAEVLLAQVPKFGPVGEGEEYEVVAEGARYPGRPGEYLLVLVVDSNDTVNEGIDGGETDNRGFAPGTFFAETFAVSVTADVESAPAGTSVRLSGAATLAGSGEPVADRDIAVQIDVRGQRRRLMARTAASGAYEVVFEPLPTEAGRYSVFAGPPEDVGTAVQDTFALHGLRLEPRSVTVDVAPGAPRAGALTLSNPGDVDETGLAFEWVGVPPGLDAALAPPMTTLSGLSSLGLEVTFTATGADPGTYPIELRVTSAEGAVATAAFAVRVRPAQPSLVAKPERIDAAVLRDRQRVVEFEIENRGGATATGLQVFLPALPWMRLASPGVPDLAPGKSARVVLLLLADENVPLGPHSGSLSIGDADRTFGTSVPFAVEVSSDRLVDVVRVRVEDEATYWSTGTYSEDGPLVGGARVQLRDPRDGSLVAEALTGPSFAGGGGPVEFHDVTEGHYVVTVEADRHAPYRQTWLFEAGGENDVRVFVPAETVRYRWTVDETDVEDVSFVHLVATFETFVPAPVVTVNPPLVDLATIESGVGQVDFRIENHGLIAAENVRFEFGQHPGWRLTPLVTELGDLEALGYRDVPVLIERLPSAAEGPCEFSACILWSLVCGELQEYCVPVVVINANDDCDDVPEFPGSGGGCWCGGDGTGGAGRPYSVSPSYAPPIDCLICDPATFEPTELLCIDVSDYFEPVIEAAEAYVQAQTLGRVDPEFGIEASGCLQTCCRDGRIGLELEATAGGSVSGTIGIGFDESVSLEFSVPVTANFPGIGETTLQLTVSGEAAIEAGASATLGGALSGTISSGCGEGRQVSASGSISGEVFVGASGTANVSIQGLPAGLEDYAQVTADLDLNVQTGINASFTYEDGVLSWEGCFDGVFANVSFKVDVGGVEIVVGLPAPYYFVPKQCLEGTTGGDLRGRVGAGLGSDLRARLPRYVGLSSVRPAGAERRSLSAASGDVCAQVVLQVDQRVTITRTAFRAALEIENLDAALPLEDVRVEFDVFAADGSLASDRFFVADPDLLGLTGVDGAGTLSPRSRGTVSWLIVPAREAAPTEPVTYSVSGVFSYRQGDRGVVVVLQPADIVVRPDPALELKYFWQRDVFGDDPFTEDVVEPSEPFSLGLLIANEGHGAARNVRIATSAPRIVDNARGLAIDFDIVGAQVGAEAVSPGLEVNFGDIAPGGRGVARWLLTSSLQGHFIEYAASFEHVDELGGARTSLIDSVSIHELIHVVRAESPADDGLPDFVTNEASFPDDPAESPSDPDLMDLPDRIHTSDGAVEPVSSVLDAVVAVEGSTVRVAASLPDAWTYLRIPDPLGGALRLAAVERADGTRLLLGFNAWQTDRTFIDGETAVRRHSIHLFDRGHGLAAEYVLIFESNAEIHCPADIAAEVDGPDGAVVTFSVTASEEFGPNPAIVCAPHSGLIFPRGATRVECFGTDLAGTTASCSFLVTVADSRPPVLECPDSVIAEGFGSAGIAAEFTVLAEDLGDPNPSVSCVPPSGTVFPTGTTEVLCTAIDDAGNASTCRFDVTVAPGMPPAISCPGDVTVGCDAPDGAVVTYDATAVDEFDPNPSLVCLPPSGGQFPIGATSVSCTATDGSGNAATCAFTVTVADTIAPEIVCPTAITVEGLGIFGAVVSFAVTATDLCDPDPALLVTPPSGSVFPPGDTVVVATATDDAGNVTTCELTVSVLPGEPPHVACPSDLSAECSGPDGTAVEFEVIASDSFDSDPEVECVPGSGSLFPLGVTDVVCAATDDAGNVATCAFSVSVLDTTAPAIACPESIVLAVSDVNDEPLEFSVTASDAGDAAPLVASYPGSGVVFEPGETEVICQSVDDSGNESFRRFPARVSSAVNFDRTAAGEIPDGLGIAGQYAALGVLVEGASDTGAAGAVARRPGAPGTEDIVPVTGPNVLQTDSGSFAGDSGVLTFRFVDPETGEPRTAARVSIAFLGVAASGTGDGGSGRSRLEAYDAAGALIATVPVPTGPPGSRFDAAIGDGSISLRIATVVAHVGSPADPAAVDALVFLLDPRDLVLTLVPPLDGAAIGERFPLRLFMANRSGRNLDTIFDFNGWLDPRSPRHVSGPFSGRLRPNFVRLDVPVTLRVKVPSIPSLAGREATIEAAVTEAGTARVLGVEQCRVRFR